MRNTAITTCVSTVLQCCESSSLVNLLHQKIFLIDIIGSCETFINDRHLRKYGGKLLCRDFKLVMTFNFIEQALLVKLLITDFPSYFSKNLWQTQHSEHNEQCDGKAWAKSKLQVSSGHVLYRCLHRVVS